MLERIVAEGINLAQPLTQPLSDKLKQDGGELIQLAVSLLV